MRRGVVVLILCAWVEAVSPQMTEQAKRECTAQGRVFLEELNAQGVTVRWCCQ